MKQKTFEKKYVTTLESLGILSNEFPNIRSVNIVNSEYKGRPYRIINHLGTYYLFQLYRKNKETGELQPLSALLDKYLTRDGKPMNYFKFKYDERSSHIIHFSGIFQSFTAKNVLKSVELKEFFNDLKEACNEASLKASQSPLFWTTKQDAGTQDSSPVIRATK